MKAAELFQMPVVRALKPETQSINPSALKRPQTIVIGAFGIGFDRGLNERREIKAGAQTPKEMVDLIGRQEGGSSPADEERFYFGSG